jgi:hypothetical protein
VIDECIHGLAIDRCDVCSPKAPPVVVAPPPAPRQVKSSLRTTSAPPRRVASAAEGKRPANVGEQRIYHVTHMSNLAGILSSGSLLADQNETLPARPRVDISSSENRDARRSTLVAGPGSPSVASHVPFFLSPNASLWEGIRAQTPDDRFSPATTSFAASEFVVLVSTVTNVVKAQGGRDEPGRAPIVVTDGDAADARTRFGATLEASERILRRLVADTESDAILNAEFLVRESVPFDAVTLVGIANDRARDAVRAILGSSAYHPRVAVYPPWFARPEDAPAD